VSMRPNTCSIAGTSSSRLKATDTNYARNRDANACRGAMAGVP
jgi:hypothetical protein